MASGKSRYEEGMLNSGSSWRGEDIGVQQSRSSVAQKLMRTVVGRVKVNFADEQQLITVPGIGPKYAAKIMKVRALVGNLSLPVLVSCLGGHVDHVMQEYLDFTPNLELEDPEEEEEAEEAEEEAQVEELAKLMTKVLSRPEFVTPLGLPKTREPRRLLHDDREDEDEDQGVVRQRRRRGPQSLPKNLSFDGKGSFAAFKQKFESYAEAYGWTEEECLRCLCWSLVGKAAEYYANITERMEELSFRDMLRRLEKRFGARELTETAQAQFQQATQNEGESLEDWADRVLTMATRAFRELPEKYANQQSVVRFCQGLHDKAAAQDAGVQRHKTMEEAMDRVKWFQHVHQAVYGKSKVSRRTRDHDEEAAVYEMRAESRERESSTLTAADVEKLVKKMGRELLEELAARGQKSRTGCFHCFQEGHIRKNCPKITCNKCRKQGHMARDCPEAKQDLNENGSGRKPNPRPQH